MKQISLFAVLVAFVGCQSDFFFDDSNDYYNETAAGALSLCRWGRNDYSSTVCCVYWLNLLFCPPTARCMDYRRESSTFANESR